MHIDYYITAHQSSTVFIMLYFIPIFELLHYFMSSILLFYFYLCDFLLFIHIGWASLEECENKNFIANDCFTVIVVHVTK